MLIGAALLLVIFGLWKVDSDFKKDSVSNDLSALSAGRLKQSRAYGRMIIKNSSDSAKRAGAIATIEKLESELSRR